MELERLLQYLAQSLGHDSFRLNENGVLSLRFEGDIVIHLEPDPAETDCHLYSTLCRVPDDPRAKATLLEALLTANCFGRGTAGSAFAIDEQASEIILCRRFITEYADPADLMRWLQDMVSTMAVWRQRLPDLLGAADSYYSGFGGPADSAFAIKI